MSDFRIELTEFPNEILVKIFNYLDSSSLEVVGQVCKKWENIVLMIHDRAWKSVTKAVMLKRSIIGPKYEKRGWIEEDHSIGKCKCVEIARDLETYDDVELLNRDMELLEKIKYGNDGLEHPSLPEIEAASRLAAAGIITSIRYLDFGEIEIDLPNIKHLSRLLRIVEWSFCLHEVTCKDLATIFSYINCEELEICHNLGDLTGAELESLTQVLKTGVEKFLYRLSLEPFFPSIEHYDGQGKCQDIELEYEYPEDEQDLIDMKKIKDWASCVGWTLTEYESDYSHIINLSRSESK